MLILQEISLSMVSKNTIKEAMITLTEKQFNTIVTIIAKKDRLQAITIVHNILEYSLSDAKAYVDCLLGI